VQVVRHVAGQKPLRADDYWKLYDALTIAEQENALLRKQNRTLENLAGKLKRKVNKLKAAVKPETRIIRPTGELEQARRDNARLKQQLSQLASRQQRLQHALLNPEKYALAKRMRTLGHDELRRVSRVLGVRHGDILFVEDCNSFSERVIDELAGSVELIIAVKPVKPKVAELLPFVILDASSIPHTQDEYFAFLDKPALQKARTDRELLRKLIEDYQQSRKVLG
jgi:predicted RNase H-like nuclease (RuvC/YqgF family)